MSEISASPKDTLRIVKASKVAPQAPLWGIWVDNVGKWRDFGRPGLRIPKSRSWRTRRSRGYLARRLKPDFGVAGNVGVLGRALLRIQGERFELPRPFRGSIPQKLDVDTA